MGVGGVFSFGGDLLSFGGSGGLDSLLALTLFVSALIMDGDCICSGCTRGNVEDGVAVEAAGLLLRFALEALLLLLLTAGIVLKCCCC